MIRLLLALLLCGVSSALAQKAPPAQPATAAPPAQPATAAPASAPPCACPKAKARRKGSVFEFSLASAHAFPIDHIGQYDDDVDIVPPSSVLLLVEYFFTQAWRGRFFYDLALTTDKRIFGDGTVTERVIPSALGVGLTWVPLRFSFLETSQIELQGTLYGAMVLEDPVEYFPMWTGRFHLMTDASEGVGIYLGIKWEMIRHTLGPFYGVGYRF